MNPSESCIRMCRSHAQPGVSNERAYQSGSVSSFRCRIHSTCGTRGSASRTTAAQLCGSPTSAPLICAQSATRTTTLWASRNPAGPDKQRPRISAYQRETSATHRRCIELHATEALSRELFHEGCVAAQHLIESRAAQVGSEAHRRARRTTSSRGQHAVNPRA